MLDCKLFWTFKERGEWVELRFMTQAIEHGYKVEAFTRRPSRVPKW